MEAVNVSGAVHHGRHASRLKTREVTSGLKIRSLTSFNSTKAIRPSSFQKSFEILILILIGEAQPES